MAVMDDLTHEARIPDSTRDGVLTLLQKAVRTIDDMWRSAQSGGDHTGAMVLGEASHGVHRALIALQSEPAVLA
jgi:hypothetical protein